MLSNVGWALALAVVAPLQSGGAQAASVSRGDRYGVATPNAHATEMAAKVLDDGGNAIDAAIVAALMISVTEPQSAGLGGGGFAIVRSGKGEVKAVDFRERAPAASDRLMYVKAREAFRLQLTEQAKSAGVADIDNYVQQRLASYKPSRDGGLAVGIPGTVSGLAEMHKRWGKLDWDDLVELVADFADEGFSIGYRVADAAERRSSCLTRYDATVWLDEHGKPLRAGHRVRLKGMAKALHEIADNPRNFYRGWIANDIIDAAKKHGGILTKADLAGYKTYVTDALKTQYRQHTLYGMPLPSSGGVIVEQILTMLDAALPERVLWGSGRFWHSYVEASRLAFRDRAQHLGDPRFVTVPLQKLRDPAYLMRQGRQIDEFSRLKVEAPKAAADEAENTAHLSVMTAAGDAVSMTFTVNYGFGSCVVAPKSQIVLNDEMDDFVAEPGVPNAYGLVGNAANEVAPGKTPLSSMSPTLVTKDGRLVGAVGSPGGPTIISNVAQLLLAKLRYGIAAKQLGLLPKVHHQWMPDVVMVEQGATEAVSESLQALGHPTRQIGSYGNFQAVFIEPEGIVAVSDPRGEGKAQAR